MADPGAGALFLLHRDLRPGFTSQPNYLNHPPACYLALSLFVPHHAWPTLRTVHLLRSVNAVLSTRAIGCTLSIAVLRNLETRLHLLFCSMVVPVPVLPFLGGTINNAWRCWVAAPACWVRNV